MINTYYVIFDTNVIVSAFLGIENGSYSAKLLDYIYEKIIIPVYNEKILKEYRDVLSRDKFPFTHKMVGDFINSIKKLGIKINPKKLDIPFVDYDDLKFYEVVMNKDKYDKKLVTGNIKHFPIQKNIKTPKEMYKIINKINE